MQARRVGTCQPQLYNLCQSNNQNRLELLTKSVELPRQGANKISRVSLSYSLVFVLSHLVQVLDPPVSVHGPSSINI